MAECVKCGYCCTVRPCYYGEWDPDKNSCVFLTEERLCGKYEELKDHRDTPAFGAGCSSTLWNTVREEKIKKDNA